MTTLEDQISAAIGAHGLWKGRLRAAVDSGKSDLSIDVVRDDRQCSFGKWLHGPELNAHDRNSPHYKKCVELHHRFHAAAAGILAMALEGKKQEASQALDGDHEFKKPSAELTRALLAWKEA